MEGDNQPRFLFKGRDVSIAGEEAGEIISLQIPVTEGLLLLELGQETFAALFNEMRRLIVSTEGN